MKNHLPQIVALAKFAFVALFGAYPPREVKPPKAPRGKDASPHYQI